MSADTTPASGDAGAPNPADATVPRTPSRAGTRGHKPDGTPWLHPITFRASAQDRDRIEKRAAKAGLPVSAYVRQSSLKTRITNTRPAADTTLADIALVQAISQVGITLAKELPRVAKPHALPDSLAAAAGKLNAVLDEVRRLVAARDAAEARRQAVIASLGHVASNLNQQTRALNSIAKRRIASPKLPLTAIAHTHAAIASLLPMLKDIIGEDDAQ